MSSIRIGVIGAGNMGRNHIRLTSEMSEFELVGIFDLNEDAKQIAEKYGVTYYSNSDELFNEIDAIVVATPSSTHFDVACKAAECGLHALIEKPLGLGKSEAIVICDKFCKSETILSVGHVERFNPVVLEVEKMLKNEEVVAINARRFSPKDLRINDADVMQDLLIHDLDIVVNALNKTKVVKISSNGKAVYNSNFVDYVHSIFEFEDGVLATIEASRTTEDKVREIDIHTKSSFIRMDLLDKSLNITRRTNYKLDTGYSPTYRQENITEKVFIPMVEPLRAELQDFAKCIQTGSTPRVNGENAAYALEIIDKMKEQIYGK